MVQRWSLVGGILLLVSLLLTGCVPKADYEAVVADRDSTLAVLQSVKSQLGSAQADVSDLKAEVSDLKAEGSDLKVKVSDLEAAVSDLEAEGKDLNAKLEPRLGQLDEVQQICDSLEPKLQIQQLIGEYLNKQAWFKIKDSSLSFKEWEHFAHEIFRIDMEKYLEAVDDFALRNAYEKAVIWKADSWTTNYASYEKLQDLLGELIEDDRNKLRAASAD